MGVYPMLLDETCFFLAVDFDGAHWQKDVQAFVETCKRLNVPAALDDQDRALADTFGFSLRKRSQRHWLERWVRMYSRRRWSIVQRSAWAPIVHQRTGRVSQMKPLT